MDIGTAKATIEEQKLIAHHLIDIKDPSQSFSVAEFQQLALTAIQDIQQKGKLPILVGGTGLYIKSVLYYPEYQFSNMESDSLIRDKWQHFLEENGEEALWQQVHQVDPITAERVHPNDTRRLIRALELFELNKAPMSQTVSSDKKLVHSPFNFLMIGLTMPRDLLYERINRRVEIMIDMGLVEEVQHLIEAVGAQELTAMQSLGYKEMIPYLQGHASLEDTIALIQQKTRQFAKRQLTWFRHMPHIEWFDLSPEVQEKNLSQIIQIVAGKFGNLENY